MPMPITLVFSDHQLIVLHGLKHLFAREQGFFVLASHANSAETLESVRRHRPAVLVLGVSPPATDGLTILREMEEENLPTRAVVLLGGIDEEEIVEAIRLGARGAVLKEMAPRLRLQCIRKVHAGGEWFETRSIAHLVWEEPAKAMPRGTEPRRCVDHGLHLSVGRIDDQRAV